MNKTTLKSLTAFLDYWNNNHLATGKHPSVPLNTYYFEALDAGFGFALKWFVTKEDFDALAAEIEFPLEVNQSKMIILFNEYRVEIEIDDFGILESIDADNQEITDLFSDFINK